MNAAMEYNKHMIHDANLLLSVDEFLEEFVGCQIALLIDFFSGYNQVELDIRSRDLMAFQTPLGLLRQMMLPMGATNSVVQFIQIVMKILEDLIPDVCLPFLDDISVKGPYSTYEDKEVCLGVH